MNETVPRQAQADATEAEQALLSALLIDPEAWAKVARQLAPSDFHLEAHRLVYEACEELAKDLRPLDPVLLFGVLDGRGLIGDAVPRALVFDLARGGSGAGNVEHYAREVKRLRAARTGGPLDPFEVLSVAHALEAEEGSLETDSPRVSTGWPRLDRALGGGLEVPSLAVLGAAPKSGKSTWAQIVAERWAEAPHGGIVYYLDLENGRKRFLRRMIGRRAKVGRAAVAEALRGGAGLPSREALNAWQLAKDAIHRVLGARLFVESTPPLDLGERVAMARRRAGKAPLLVVIDSLQKLPMKLDERRAGVDGWLRTFERLRLAHDAVFLVISEITRAQGTEGGFKRGITAFKESGGVEYAADLALTFSKDTEDDPTAPSTLEIVAARESEDGTLGPVASYRPVFPHFGLEEVEAVRAPAPAKGTKPAAPSTKAAKEAGYDDLIR